MKKLSTTFGKRFQRLLSLHNITQETVARACGVRQATVSLWINNDSPDYYPHVKHLKKISSLLKISLDELVDYENEALETNFNDAKKPPIWLIHKQYEGFCLVDRLNKRFVGVNGFELSFTRAKKEILKCYKKAPAEFYQFSLNKNPLTFKEIKDLYKKSVFEEKKQQVWVQALDNGKIKNNWLNGWYELRKESAAKGDQYFLYDDYESHWLAFKI